MHIQIRKGGGALTVNLKFTFMLLMEVIKIKGGEKRGGGNRWPNGTGELNGNERREGRGEEGRGGGGGRVTSGPCC